MVVSKRSRVISKALTELYRLVVVLRRNIDLLSKCSTREGSSLCSTLGRIQPKILQISTKLKRMNCTTVNINNTIIININCSFAFGFVAILPPPSSTIIMSTISLATLGRFYSLAFGSFDSLAYGSAFFNSLATLDYYYYHQQQHRRWWGGCCHYPLLIRLRLLRSAIIIPSSPTTAGLE